MADTQKGQHCHVGSFHPGDHTHEGQHCRGGSSHHGNLIN
jgi:hypothetical protein